MNGLMDMKYMLRIGIAAAVVPAAAAPALANPPGEQAITNIPSGTTDSAPVGSPGGGEGGPDMRISREGHRNWPEFPAPVEGSPAVTANHYPYGANATIRR